MRIGMNKPPLASSGEGRSQPETTTTASTTAAERGALTAHDRFLAACRCAPVDRPPVWLMRQAGRCLPEYRALRERHSFLELVQTPELAAEVTLQPIRRFGFDAAIIFSDILVVPEAMGQSYDFPEAGGIRMAFAVGSEADVDRLSAASVGERARYVAEALGLAKSALKGETSLIGFSGAPWTLANFMVEGGRAKPFRKARALLQSHRRLLDALCEKLTLAVTTYLQMQIEAGADAVQLFDTLAGELDDATYAQTGAVWVQQIVARLGNRVPVILFAKGINRSWPVLVGTGADVLSVDWQVRLKDLRRLLPAQTALQGNLHPQWLLATAEDVRRETRTLLEDMRGAAGYIVNLGHGVPPGAKLENLEALVDTVRHAT